MKAGENERSRYVLHAYDVMRDRWCEMGGPFDWPQILAKVHWLRRTRPDLPLRADRP